MTAETITAERVQDALRAAAEEYGPTWVDPNAAEGLGCRNVYTDHEDVTRYCIAAWVVRMLLADEVSESALSHGGDEPICDWLEVNELEDRFTLSAVADLRRAQTLQDRGVTWGDIASALDLSLGES